MKRRIAWAVAFGGLLASGATAPRDLPREATIGTLELVGTFEGPMPTGVTVSRGGRIFLNFPRWGDKVDATVVEWRDGKPVPYPPKLNQQASPTDRPSDGLVSVQSVVVDPADRLWILDTGSVKFGPTRSGGPKLIGVDLAKNQVVKTITFPQNVALSTSYLNDVRFDLRRGKGGMAFITDSSGTGPNGIVVVDLDSGASWRRLHDHPSTKADRTFLPIVEGQVLMNRLPGQKPAPLSIGSDGIALSADGERLYYCPLASRKLYSVPVDALVDSNLPDPQVAGMVTDHGEKGASDGLESDSKDRVYATNYEHNAILRRNPDGSFETLVHDPRLLWPDTLSLASDGYLYVTANQLHRQPNFHEGRDLRKKPYSLFRIKTDGKPVSLR